MSNASCIKSGQLSIIVALGIFAYLVLATIKPNANGDRNGERMKPIVQRLSYA